MGCNSSICLFPPAPSPLNFLVEGRTRVSNDPTAALYDSTALPSAPPTREGTPPFSYLRTLRNYLIPECSSCLCRKPDDLHCKSSPVPVRSTDLLPGKNLRISEQGLGT